ncbi:CLAVATA3/ESR (CLE)-related protein 46-like [Quillaja saponaria]|uniref:CLAVATA3/ESR (CLE)-related protein 46-like n=1 Tax=Quillaja saponaria TaxID=32244 RepID=A0AAD7Q6N0_QUISA|nr:CLAVATA3/ESR (CLE)-related protein 46-like [Quillaja saponaria]
MKREQNVYVFIMVFILIASEFYYSKAVRFQAAKSVEVDLGAAQPRASSSTMKNKPITWIKQENIHKAPSGPNPIGNRQPPTKHD